jgi:hypothetical protein
MKYLYVFRSPSGLVRKIGFTNKPKIRCRRLRTRNHIGEVGDWVIEYTRECANYVAAEKHAHALLSAKRNTREYFAVTFEEAQAAVDVAIDRASGPLADIFDQLPIENEPTLIERVALLENRILDQDAIIERLERKMAMFEKLLPA